MRFIALFFLLLPILAFGQTTQEIFPEFINQNPRIVKKNSRLELGIILPEDVMKSINEYLHSLPHQRNGLNPFVSWDVDIIAKFTHLETETNFSAIGFWYEEMKRNPSQNKWDRIPTRFPFRVRYAPSLLGEWEVEFSVTVRGVLSYHSQPLKFNVVDSNHKGFVSLNPRTKYLERDGRTIIPTGINLPYPYNYNNLTYSLKKDETLDIKSWENYSWMVEDYISKGGEYFRFFLHPSATDIEFEEVGNYQKRQNFAWEVDNIVLLCEQTNTLMQFDLLFHQIFMKLGDYFQFKYDYSNYWHDAAVWPYKDPNDISGYSYLLKSKTPSDMFLNPEGMKYLKEKTRYIMARWGYSPSLSIIELASEPWHIDQNPFTNESPYDEATEEGDRAREAIYLYHKEIAAYIKDTIKYNRHLLSAVGAFPSGNSNIFSHENLDGIKFADSTWFIDNIDVITISYYSGSPEKLIISKNNQNNECGKDETSMECTIERLKNTYGKPVIFGESDHGDDSHVCSDYQGHKIDIMRYPFTGAIGHHVWAAFGYEEGNNGEVLHDERAIWLPIIQAKDYFNSDWFINLINSQEEWGKQRERFKGTKRFVLETQYIVGENSSKVGGYLYNRTFNLNTAGNKNPEEISGSPCDFKGDKIANPITITWKPKRLKIDGVLSNKKYQITFYDYKNMQPLENQTYKSNLFGKLKIIHPPLTPEKEGLPLIWYQVEQSN